MWGALSNVAGPMALALVVKVTGSWGSGMFVIGAAAACGAVLWLFVHPERPLLAVAACDGPPAAGGRNTRCGDAQETRADAGRVSEPAD